MLSIREPYLNAIVSGLICLLISALVLGSLYLGFFLKLNPEFMPYAQQASGQGTQALTLTGRDFRPIDIAPARIEGTRHIIERYVDNQALLLSQEWLEADQFPFLRFDVEGIHRDMLVRLFWRRIDMAPGQYHYAELHTSGDGRNWHNLVQHPEWRGRVIELGIGGIGRSNDERFVLMRDQPFVLNEIRLEPFSRWAVMKTIWSEWTFFEGWTHTSMNRYLGVPDRSALIRPNAVFGVWLLGSLMVLAAWVGLRASAGKDRRQPGISWTPLLASMLAMVVLVWIAQDSLRQSFRIKQAIDTYTLYASQPLVDKVARTRMRCDQMREQLAQDCTQHPPLPHL